MDLIFSVKGYRGIEWEVIAIYCIGENPSGELHRVSVLGKKEAKIEQLQRGLAEFVLVYQQLQPYRRQCTMLDGKNLGFRAVLAGYKRHVHVVGIFQQGLDCKEMQMLQQKAWCKMQSSRSWKNMWTATSLWC